MHLETRVGPGTHRAPINCSLRASAHTGTPAEITQRSNSPACSLPMLWLSTLSTARSLASAVDAISTSGRTCSGHFRYTGKS